MTSVAATISPPDAPKRTSGPVLMKQKCCLRRDMGSRERHLIQSSSLEPNNDDKALHFSSDYPPPIRYVTDRNFGRWLC